MSCLAIQGYSYSDGGSPLAKLRGGERYKYQVK